MAYRKVIIHESGVELTHRGIAAMHLEKGTAHAVYYDEDGNEVPAPDPAEVESEPSWPRRAATP